MPHQCRILQFTNLGNKLGHGIITLLWDCVNSCGEVSRNQSITCLVFNALKQDTKNIKTRVKIVNMISICLLFSSVDLLSFEEVALFSSNLFKYNAFLTQYSVK